MNFGTNSLLLSWMELGALRAILFRLSSVFNLIANTQRELRRAIHHLGEHRGAQMVTGRAYPAQEIAPVSHPAHRRANPEITMGADDHVYLPM